MIYEKISLKERLKRAEKGFSTSPQFSRKIIDDFCNTPVIPALEYIGAFKERQLLCELMNNKQLNEAYTCADNPTFYDVASVITRHYLKYGAKPPKELQPLTDIIRQLICIYFGIFDAVADAIHRRISVNEALKSLFDFLRLPFGDYYSYIELSLDNRYICKSTKYTDKINAYKKRMGMSANMYPLMIYSELKENVWGNETGHFEIYDLPSMTECEHFIDFFILPITLITSVNKIKDKGDAENEQFFE